jgi:hypothetical protein
MLKKIFVITVSYFRSVLFFLFAIKYRFVCKIKKKIQTSKEKGKLLIKFEHILASGGIKYG